MTTAARPESTTATPAAAPSSAPAPSSSPSPAPAAAPSSAPVSTSGRPVSARMEDEFLHGTASSPKDPFRDAAQDLFEPEEVAAETGVEAAPADPNAAPEPVVDPNATPEPELTGIPFKYQVDGQEVAFDGIEEVPGEGAIVSQDALGRLRDRLQVADRMEPQVRQYAQVVDRFQKVGGFERMEQLEANAAVLQAVGQKFLQILAEDGPKTEEGYAAALAELATDPRARALMLRELDVLTRDAELTARGKFKGDLQGVDRAGQESSSRAQAITGAVAEMGRAITQAMGVTLTAEDLAEAQAVFGQFGETIYRMPTAQEAAALRIPATQPIIDYPKMHPWFTARAQLRAREATDRNTSATATAENAARLAAATPTRPASTRAATQRPGQGKSPVPPRADRPEITDWRTRMKMGLRPIADETPANP